ncbi:MAG: hypothetical protein AAFX50_06195 [Acidobacteriota bacterium]
MSETDREWLFRTHGGAPFVGWAGSKTTIRIFRTEDKIACRITSGTLWILRAGMTLFGPGLTAWLAAYAADLVDKKVPWPIVGVLSLVAALAWWILLRSFLLRPRFEASTSRSRLDLYRRPRGEPFLRLHADEVASLGLKPKIYRPDEGPSVVNQMVMLRTRAGEELALCASPDAAEMRRLRDELATILRAQKAPPEAAATRLDRARLGDPP